MSLKERVYSVLVVSMAEKFNSALSTLLTDLHYKPIHVVNNVSAAKRILNERSFDYVIINSPLPDENGIRFAIDIAAANGAVVLLLVQSEVFEDIFDKAVEHGVFALAKPISRDNIYMALTLMKSVKARLTKLEQKSLSVEEKMEEIRIVNRAKWLLISELKMDESQAHRYIEKQAMDRCVAKKTVAEEIIKTYT